MSVFRNISLAFGFAAVTGGSISIIAAADRARHALAETYKTHEACGNTNVKSAECRAADDAVFGNARHVLGGLAAAGVGGLLLGAGMKKPEMLPRRFKLKTL